jgi:hypothetical protein
MSYIKKDNYPSLKKPGIYQDGSTKELGLDSDNLEKFSLGSWLDVDKKNKQLWFGLPPAEIVDVDATDTTSPFNLAFENNITLDGAADNQGNHTDFKIIDINDFTYLFILTTNGKVRRFVLQDNGTWLRQNQGTENNEDLYSSVSDHRLNYNLPHPGGPSAHMKFKAFDFNHDGTKFYVAVIRGLTNKAVFAQYNLANPFSFSSGVTKVFDTHDVGSSISNAIFEPMSINFGDNGTKLYILEGGSGIIHFDTATTNHTNTMVSTYWQGFPLHEHAWKYLRGGNLIQINLDQSYLFQTQDFDNEGTLRRKTIPLRLKTNDTMLQQATETPFGQDFVDTELYLPTDDIAIQDITTNNALIDNNHYLTYPVDIEFSQDGNYLFVLYNGYYSYEAKAFDPDINYESYLKQHSQTRIVRYKLTTPWDVKRTTGRTRPGITFDEPDDEFNLGYLDGGDRGDGNGYNQQDYNERTDQFTEKFENIKISNFLLTNLQSEPIATTDSRYYGTQYKFQLRGDQNLLVMNRSLSLFDVPINFDTFMFEEIVQEVQPTTPSYNIQLFGIDDIVETDRINNDPDNILEEIDYYLNTKSSGSQEELLYYDRGSNETSFLTTSYPLKVELNIDIYLRSTGAYQDFDNQIEVAGNNIPEYPEGFSDTDYLTLDAVEDEKKIDFPLVPLSKSYFTYQVIDWGDEKVKIDTIKNSFYFNHYTESTEEYSIKKNILTQIQNTKSIEEIATHVYNTPGIKTIKVLVFRYTRDRRFLIQTTLMIRNIVVNDGAALSQDFSIFGGTDFNFLPLSNKEAIIGGLDEDSKYNNSVEKIKQNDNFIQEDYLERASSRDFIDNFNNQLYGESPGQLDLSTTRMFKKPLDIYDFITDDKQSIVDNNFVINTLPINSFATDIFISNNDCIVDLNPQDIEYLSIQNKTGTADKTILIGDYKVNQPKDGKIQRQGVMQTPLLDDTQDKQAF